jgi:nucleotide-binding universal stress UspA family protein
MGRVVVGVDGSACAQVALEWAVAEARLRGATLEAVFCYHLPTAWMGMGDGFGATVIPDLNVDQLETYATDTLDKAIAAVGDTADMDVVRKVIGGPPARELLEAARDADLLVLGTRGHGEVGGLLLGSVSMHCVHHAECPVVVIRTAHDGN